MLTPSTFVQQGVAEAPKPQKTRGQLTEEYWLTFEHDRHALSST